MKQVNLDWSKIKSELLRFRDINAIQKEIQRLKAEVLKFDIHTHLSPSANQRLNLLEKRYSELVATIGVLQKQVEKEVTKGFGQLKQTRSEAAKHFTNLKKIALEHKGKIEKASVNLKQALTKKVIKSTAAKAPRKRSKTSAAKTTTTARA